MFLRLAFNSVTLSLRSSEAASLTYACTVQYRVHKSFLGKSSGGNYSPMENDRELLKGSTDSLLLALLAEQPMYGYQLVKELERRSQGYFQFREGTLYPALHRLEKDGLISGKWKPSPMGKDRRT